MSLPPAASMRLLTSLPRRLLAPASIRPVQPTPSSRTQPFSTTPTPHGSASKTIAKQHAAIPPYPHGPAQWYKQSNFGLYGGTKIQFGNLVSSNMGLRNRRKWKPNVRQKRLWSAALQKHLRIRVTARALRTIDRCGGLDAYLLGEGKGRIRELGMGGWLLRWRVMQTEAVKRRWDVERRERGLLPEGETEQGGLGMSEVGVREGVEGLDRELERVTAGAQEEGEVEGDEEIVLGQLEDVIDGGGRETAGQGEVEGEGEKRPFAP